MTKIEETSNQVTNVKRLTVDETSHSSHPAPKDRKMHHKPRIRLVILLLLLALLTKSQYIPRHTLSPVPVEEMPNLSLEGAERILVISPHPDDETLAVGGVMQAAVEQGVDVRVALLTNGDGQGIAPLAIQQVRPSPDAYIRHGVQRQQEALEALDALGISKNYVYFLGYPDRGLYELWLDDWNERCPRFAAYTRRTQSPYEITYNSQAKYCGSDLLSDLITIFREFLPDIVFVPHPNDTHLDHEAGSNFARMALRLISVEQPDYHPAVWGYVVHYGPFPQPRGTAINVDLSPPLPLFTESANWVKWDLTEAHVRNKLAALQRYSSQLRLLGSYIQSFARQNEVFVELPMLELSPLEFADLTLLEAGVDEMPRFAEPRGENLRRILVGAGDLVGWKIARVGANLVLNAEVREPISPLLEYRIFVKTPHGVTKTYNGEQSKLITTRVSFTAIVDLEELNFPSVIAFSAEVRQRVALDQTGWNVIILRDWLP